MISNQYTETNKINLSLRLPHQVYVHSLPLSFLNKKKASKPDPEAMKTPRSAALDIAYPPQIQLPVSAPIRKRKSNLIREAAKNIRVFFKWPGH